MALFTSKMATRVNFVMTAVIGAAKKIKSDTGQTATVAQLEKLFPEQFDALAVDSDGQPRYAGKVDGKVVPTSRKLSGVEVAFVSVKNATAKKSKTAAPAIHEGVSAAWAKIAAASGIVAGGVKVEVKDIADSKTLSADI